MANLHETGIIEFGARNAEQKSLQNISLAMTAMNAVHKSAWDKTSSMSAENKQVYADEFRLSIDLFGDANHFGLLVISDSRDKTFNPVPQASIPLEKATPEAIGAAIAEYIRKNCSEK